jgi:hypothetical protein
VLFFATPPLLRNEKDSEGAVDKGVGGSLGVKGLRGHSARYLAEKAKRAAAKSAEVGEKRSVDAMDIDIGIEDSTAPAAKRIHSSSSDPQHLPPSENKEEDEALILQTLSSLFAESAKGQLSEREKVILGEWQRRNMERDGRVAARRDGGLTGDLGGWGVGGGWVGAAGIGGGGIGGQEGFRDDVDNRVGS